MPIRKIYSYLLVSLQFIAILLIIIYSFFNNFGFIQITLTMYGVLLGVYAIFSMRKSKLRITPELAENATLIKTGPYKYIRHPMYSAVLLFCLGFFLTNIWSMTAIIYLSLIIILNLKIIYEEKLLNIAFSNYKSYAKKTKKLIPYIY